MPFTIDKRARRLLGVAAWILLGLCFLPVDVPISRLMVNDFLPGEVRGMLCRAEVFGHGYGALGIVITIYILDPVRRGKLIHIAACFLTAGLSADLIKLQVWRWRPRIYVESAMNGSTFLGTIWTNDQFNWPNVLDHSGHSFPSAHTAGAVALAYSLGKIYPRGRIWFYVLAGLCAMNRLDGGAHFASDICWGAALGYLLATQLPDAERMEVWLADRRRPRTADFVKSRRYSEAA